MAEVYYPNHKTENACRIMHKNGFAYLLSPEGNLIPKQISCEVISRVNERPYAIVKLFVNLDDTVEPAPTITVEEKNALNAL